MTENCVVKHVGGDCGCFTTGNTFDEFGLFFNEEHIATLKVTYENDEKKTSCELTMHSETFIPGCYGDFHMIASIMSTVMHHFTSDHEFYQDAFQDEDGNPIAHALMLPV